MEIYFSSKLSKLVCIPFTLFVQYVAYKQNVSKLVKLTLVPIILGVGYATIYDLSLNPVGLGILLLLEIMICMFWMKTIFTIEITFVLIK